MNADDMPKITSFIIGALLLAVIDAASLQLQHLNTPAPRTGSKWVVITTINYPTETVKTLASAHGWRVVVVADQKTPKDWQLDNVDILDVEKQKTLEFKILPLLPYNHYGCAI
jgi:hypothetical protein